MGLWQYKKLAFKGFNRILPRLIEENSPTKKEPYALIFYTIIQMFLIMKKINYNEKIKKALAKARRICKITIYNYSRLSFLLPFGFDTGVLPLLSCLM